MSTGRRRQSGMFHGLFLVFLVLTGTMVAGDAAGNGEAKQEPESGRKTGRGTSDFQTASSPSGEESPLYRITVTATRTPTSLQRVGQSVTVINADEIAQMGAATVAEVLETVPGISVVQTGSFGGVTSVFTRGGEGDFNLVLVDGLPVNQPGGLYDFADLSTANVERIEVIRGPASVLYGTDAVSSVIHIITRPGSGKPAGELVAQGGSFGTGHVRAGVSGEAGRLHFSTAGLYSDTDGIFDLNNRYRRGEISGRLAWQVGKATLAGSIRWLDANYHFPTEFTGQPVDPNDFRRSDELAFNVSWDHQLRPGFRSRVHYGLYDRDFENLTIEDGVVDFFSSTFASSQRRHYLDWQNTFQRTSHVVTLGTAWEREEERTEGLSRRGIGLYVQDQVTVSPRLFVTGGLRHEANSRFRNFTTGSLTVSFLAAQSVKLRASLANGFRAPAFSEIAGFPDFGIRGNPELKPEKNAALDFGIDWAGSRSGISGTAFFNRFSDLIEFSFLVPPEEPNFLNIEKARSRGLELEGFLNLASGLRIRADYTLTDTEVTDAGTVPGGGFQEGAPLLRRPRHMAGLSLSLEKWRPRLRFDLRFKGQRDDIQFFPDFSSKRVTLPSYWKAGVALTLPLVNYPDSGRGLDLVFRGDNLFDREYTEVAGFQSPGVRLLAGIKVRY